VYSDAVTCSTSASALSSACSCIGLTFSSSTGTCVGVSTATCNQFTSCAAAYFTSVNVAAALGSTCSSLAAIKPTLSALAAGSIYTGGSLEGACQAFACSLANTTTTNCINNLNSLYNGACTNPYTYLASITIGGNFVCNSANIAAIKAALRIDLSAKLGYNVTIIGDIICGSATAVFSVPVSGNAPGLQANLQAAVANPAFLTSLAAVLGVPVSSLTVQSITTLGTPVPGSQPITPGSNGGFQFGASSRATWSVLSVLAAAIALAF